MNKRTIEVILIILAFGLLGGLVYLTTSKRETYKARETIKVAYTADSVATQVLFDLAKEKDYFSKYNLAVEETVNDKTSHILVSTGKVDLSISVIVLPLNNYLNDEKLLWVSNVFSNTPDLYMVLKDRNATNIKFGVSKIGGITNIIADSVASNLGWKKDNIEYVQAGDITTRFAYLEKGIINATFIYPGEGLDQARQKGYTILEPKEIYGNVTVPVGVFTSQTTLDNRRPALKRFVLAIDDFKQYLLDNRTETIKYIQSKYNISEDEANGVYSGIAKYTTFEKPKTTQIDTIKTGIVEILKPKNPDRGTTGFINLITSAK